MGSVCPKCGAQIAFGDRNPKLGVLFCRKCNEMFNAETDEEDDRITLKAEDDFDLSVAPEGVNTTDDGDCVVIDITVRKVGMGLLLTLFGGAFAAGGVLMLCKALFSMAIVEIGLLFGSIPFMCFGLVIFGVGLFHLCGYTQVAIGPRGCCFKDHACGIGWTTRFAAQEVECVFLKYCGEENGKACYQLGLQRNEKKDLDIGLFLTDEQQIYLGMAMDAALQRVRGQIKPEEG